MHLLRLQVEFGGLSQSCGGAPDLAPQKQRTKPLIPEMCFTSTGCSTDINLSTPYLEEDGTSMLVSCKKCSVRVHASECLAPLLVSGSCPSGHGRLPGAPATSWPPQAVPQCRDCLCVLGVLMESECHVALGSMQIPGGHESLLPTRCL